MKLNPYLVFDGQCKEAMSFYSEGLGLPLAGMFSFGESPMADQTPADQHNRIMHACIALEGGGMLMASDGRPGEPATHDGFSISIHPEDTTRAEELFNALSEGGAVIMPLTETFWAERFGMFTDKFGVGWMINVAKQGE
jgi:PhnB protein